MGGLGLNGEGRKEGKEIYWAGVLLVWESMGGNLALWLTIFLFVILCVLLRCMPFPFILSFILSSWYGGPFLHFQFCFVR